MADHSEHGILLRPMYWVWGWLLGLTLIEVVLAYFNLNLMLMLVTLLGLSIVKAALIIAYFMHMKFERLNLVLTIIPALIATILLLNAFFPDAVRIKERGVNRTVAAPADHG